MAVEINYELRYDLTVEPPIKGENRLSRKDTSQDCHSFWEESNPSTRRFHRILNHCYYYGGMNTRCMNQYETSLSEWGDHAIWRRILTMIIIMWISMWGLFSGGGLPPLRHAETGCRPRQSEHTWEYLQGLKLHLRPLISWQTTDWTLRVRGRVQVCEPCDDGFTGAYV